MSPVVSSMLVVTPLLCVLALVATVFVRWTARHGSAPTRLVRAALGASIATTAAYMLLAIVLQELWVVCVVVACPSLAIAVLAARSLRGGSRS